MKNALVFVKLIACLAFLTPVFTLEPENSNCGPNEEKRCVQPCPPEKKCWTRDVRVTCIDLPQLCSEECVCSPGYYRNRRGTCVTEEECDITLRDPYEEQPSV
ncbi:hypothetical protein evm_003673 [Chilo suppressalis]|nr:hypothetical protein evm_003673 [Chilo suppressalis]